MTYTDWLGQPIEVGSPILYAISNSHYAEVVWAEVLEIIPVLPKVRNIHSDVPEELKKPQSQRKVIGTEEYWDYGRKFKLKVQPYYQNSDFREEVTAYWTRGIKSDYGADDGFVFQRALPQPVTIQNVEKVVVFPLPEGVREHLEWLLDEAVNRANKKRSKR